MNAIRIGCLILLLLVTSSACDAGGADEREANDSDLRPATLARVADYRDWGWESFVFDNGLLRLAVVPVIGGRVMEFSLDGEESIWVNPQQFGTTPSPSEGSWPNHGGYKNWPAPQSRWNWPPPPTLDHGAYEASVLHESADSVSVQFSSSIERWGAPGLRFERTITLFAGAAKARVDQTIINERDQDAQWSMWDITQHLVQHGDAGDFDNFRVYFPINPESQYGPDGVRVDKPSAAWTGAVHPGIYEIRFRPDNAKLFADSRGGWICYADLRDGYAYVKKFEVANGAPYPDQGADVEVYVSIQNYVEVEVLSPLQTLAANGGRYTFTETWLAARTNGPVLDVNEMGLVNHPLEVDAASRRATGQFGVFHLGSASLVAADATGRALWESDAFETHPARLLEINQAVNLPEGAVQLQLVVTPSSGETGGVLAATDL